MILFRSVPGYGNSSALIRYRTPWLMDEVHGAIYFLRPQYSVKNIVELVNEASGDIAIHHYPHNDKGFIQEFHTKFLNVGGKETLEAFMKDYPQETRRLVYIDFSIARVEEVVPETFFQRIIPHEQLQELNSYILYISKYEENVRFHVTETLYTSDGNYKNLFELFVLSSKYWVRPVSKNTCHREGNVLAYKILEKWYNLSISPSAPAPENLGLPTSGSLFPDFSGLNIGALTQVSTTRCADLIHTAESKETAPVEKKVVSMDETVVKECLRTKMSVPLSILIDVGFKEVLDMIPDNVIWVGVDLDYHGIAKKICIWKKTYYIIPVDPDLDIFTYFDIPEELCNIVDEEKFPKKD